MDFAVLTRDFPFWLCDIWGVLHAGGPVHDKALGALKAHRSQGGRVVFISNSPQPSAKVAQHLAQKGLSGALYDGIVTSGDVTMRLAAARSHDAYFLIGPADYDRALLEKLPNQRVMKADDAQFLLCTGPDDMMGDEAEDYQADFAHYLSLGLPMLCANPDRVVRIGDGLYPCAGALADLYAQMGGEVIMAGKPEPAIYRDGLRLLGCVDRKKVLAIGDNIGTDAAGAAAAGLAFAIVESGIHAGEFADEAAIRAHLTRELPSLELVHVLAELG